MEDCSLELLSISTDLDDPFLHLFESIEKKLCQDGDVRFTPDELDFMNHSLNGYREYLNVQKSFAKSGSKEHRTIKKRLPQISRALSKINVLIDEVSLLDEQG